MKMTTCKNVKICRYKNMDVFLHYNTSILKYKSIN